MGLFEYCIAEHTQILELLLEHCYLSFIALGLAILIGVPLGFLISYFSKSSKLVLGFANIVQAVPSLALLGFFVPLMGIGVLPAVIVVTLYALLPIIKNTYTGIKNINPQTIEAAKGIGLTKFQILIKIQMPMAFPVIMTGVRISAVTGVGLMTSAAFVGAGGLGFLIFSGIRLVNMNQILAGAIPACLLALLIDYVFGIVEKLAGNSTVIHSNKERKKAIRYRKIKAAIAGVCIVVTAAGLIMSEFYSRSTSADFDKGIVVGCKDYSEQEVLMYMAGELIKENTDIDVTYKPDLGGTQVIFTALKKGDIDMYVEYSGTAYADTLGHPPIPDTDLVYNTVKQELKEQYDIETLDSLGCNNTYILAVTQETADKYGLKTLSDLAKVGNQLKLGAVFEFLNREDGLGAVSKTYDFSFRETVGLENSQRYTAIQRKDVDVMDAYATDGLLEKYKLVSLDDDKHCFPPYYTIPLVRSDTLEQYPEVAELVNSLAAYLSNEKMSEMNYKVDVLQQKAEDVAREFLLENGLIK